MPDFLKCYQTFLKGADALQPLMLLIVRLMVAYLFWISGQVKIDDFDTTVALFRDEYQVPFIPPYLAALAATFFELACPVFLVLGLATRLAALPLLGMTGVIYLTYDQNIEVLYWAILLGIIVSVGAGKLSLDQKIKDNNLCKG